VPSPPCRLGRHVYLLHHPPRTSMPRRN
jgi:hypothetical protein